MIASTLAAACPLPLLAVLAAPPLPGPQSAGPTLPYVVSPEISERHVTFRLRAPRARDVTLVGSWDRAQIPMTRDAAGVWSVAVGPLPAGVHGYHFAVDGLRVADPANPRLRPAPFGPASLFEIEGDASPVPPLRAARPGAVRVYELRVRGGAIRRLHVYTPAAHERAAARLPALYLLHGTGDTGATWTEYGFAHRIMDNLIADRAAAPAVVVMPEGHVVRARTDEPLDSYLARVGAAFAVELLEDVVPFVERHLGVRKDAAGRALLGFSLGGYQALVIARERPRAFGWVGAVSPPLLPDGLRSAPPPAWARACPTLSLAASPGDDRLADLEALAVALRGAGIRASFRDLGATPWGAWREHLADVVRALFPPRR